MTALHKEPEFSSLKLPDINTFNLWGVRFITQHTGSGMQPMDGATCISVLNMGNILAYKHTIYHSGSAENRSNYAAGFDSHSWQETGSGQIFYFDLAQTADAFRRIHAIVHHLAGIEHIGFRRKYWDILRISGEQMAMLTAHRQWRDNYVLASTEDAPERCLVVFTPMKKNWYRITLDPAVLAELRGTGEVAPRQFRKLPRWLDNFIES